MEPPSLPDSEKIAKLISFYQRYIQPHFSDFINEENINAQFRGILNDIAARRPPHVIADNVGAALRRKLIGLQKGMKDNQDEFYNLMIELVSSIMNHLDMSIHVWKDRVIYFRDVESIWIACEPMLDLIDSGEGGFDLLERQLKHVNEIVYFLKDTSYYNDLTNILKTRNLDISKLKCVEISSVYQFPVVIYHTKKYRHGMCGKAHPNIKKDKSGKYNFAIKLDTDWLSYLTREFIDIHYENLRKYIEKSP